MKATAESGTKAKCAKHAGIPFPVGLLGFLLCFGTLSLAEGASDPNASATLIVAHLQYPGSGLRAALL